MRISDWSSDVCSSDLDAAALGKRVGDFAKGGLHGFFVSRDGHLLRSPGIFEIARTAAEVEQRQRGAGRAGVGIAAVLEQARQRRSEEHTSELQSLTRISYAVFCLKKKKTYRCIISHNI